MTAFKSFPSLMALGLSLLLSACTVAKPLSAEEEELKNDLDVSNYYPATRETRDNIQTQPLFAQAAFWGREYDLNPSDLESAIKLSAAVRKLGNAQRAIEIAQTTRALYPRDPYLNAEFAAALIAEERALDAMQPLDEALRIAPGYARLWSLKGAALDQTEQYDLARKHYERALRITPNDPNILANLGLSYALSGDPVTAETWLRRASNLPGAGAGVHQNLALVLQLQGKTAEANKINHLSRGDQRLPPPPVPAHQATSALQNNQGQRQNLRPQAQRPTQRSAQRPIQRPTQQSAQRSSNSAAQKPFPAGGQLTPEQQNVLSQISGSLNPNQKRQRLAPVQNNGYQPRPSVIPARTQPQNANPPLRGAARRRR